MLLNKYTINDCNDAVNTDTHIIITDNVITDTGDTTTNTTNIIGSTPYNTTNRAHRMRSI